LNSFLGWFSSISNHKVFSKLWLQH
jgi:hypothetical protein